MPLELKASDHQLCRVEPVTMTAVLRLYSNPVEDQKIATERFEGCFWQLHLGSSANLVQLTVLAGAYK